MDRNYENPSFKIPGEYKRMVAVGVIMVLVIICVNLFFFTVDEREQVVVKQFDEVIKIVISGDRNVINEQIKDNPQLRGITIDNRKGLHFKLPFIQSVEFFSAMKLTYDTDVREVITRDQKK